MGCSTAGRLANGTASVGACCPALASPVTCTSFDDSSLSTLVLTAPEFAVARLGALALAPLTPMAATSASSANPPFADRTNRLADIDYLQSRHAHPCACFWGPSRSGPGSFHAARSPAVENRASIAGGWTLGRRRHHGSCER